MERKRLIERAVGGSPELQEEHLKELEDIYQDTDREELGDERLEKSPEFIALIPELDGAIRSVVEHYGGRHLPLREDKISLVPSGYIEGNTDLRHGYTNAINGEIVIDARPSLVTLARTIAHEAMHLNSFKSIDIHESGDRDLRRSGFSGFKNRPDGAEEKMKFFDAIEEAIVETCAIEAVDHLQNSTVIGEELRASKIIVDLAVQSLREHGASKEALADFQRESHGIFNAKERLNTIEAAKGARAKKTVTEQILRDAFEQKELIVASREGERQHLRKTIDRIVEADSTLSHEKVFQLFAEAHFTGHYLPIARVVERTLGKGAFRTLAEIEPLAPKESDELKIDLM